MRSKYLHITEQNQWSRPLAPAMLPFMKRLLRKYNGALALTLSLILIVSGSLQVVHDHLIDHEHTEECAMYMVDGKQPLSHKPATCIAHKQVVESTPFFPIQLVLSYVYKQQPRAPPHS